MPSLSVELDALRVTVEPADRALVRPCIGHRRFIAGGRIDIDNAGVSGSQSSIIRYGQLEGKGCPAGPGRRGREGGSRDRGI